jgi:hypothetical protein
MNLIKLSRSEEHVKDLYNIEEYRKIDYDKFEKLLHEMWSSLKDLHPDFDYKIEKNKLTSIYSGFGRDHQYQYIISHRFKDTEAELKLNVPELIYGSYFILANSYYIPTMVLERLPIDKNNKKNAVFVSLSNKHVFAITKSKTRKNKGWIVTTSQNKVISLDYFAAAVFHDRPEYLEELKEYGMISKIYKYNKVIKDVVRMVGFFSDTFFKENMMFSDFMNQYYALPYHRALWKRIYGVETFEDIFYNAVKAAQNEEVIFDLSDLRNRRLVMAEYLISPVYDTYYRMLNMLTDKEGTRQIILPNMNANVIITTGFRQLLHGKQIYDIASPWATALKYKVSQKISIIQKEVPKSWSQLHKTHYGIVDPINISPSDFGSVITYTRNARVDKFGMFEVKNNGVRTFEWKKS